MSQHANPLAMTAITYEMNLDLKRFERNIYDYFDWLKDVGGLSKAIFFIGNLVVACLQFEPVN